ncbi:MAG TPA: helical backbone metal receptor [Candidatus Limnocylindrales bacterium]|nr:helical backbone metal receptor [Candidatus Limnocylindrales bacterium]
MTETIFSTTPRRERAVFPAFRGFTTRAVTAAALASAAVVTWNLAAVTCARAAEGAAPKRIISLAPAITETLFALGLGARVVGVSTYCDYPPDAAALPKVGTFTEPVAEVIVALHPDLVLTSPSPGNETAVRAIERTGVRVAVVQSEGAIAEARSAMLDIARNVGAIDEGNRLVAELDARLAALKARARDLPHLRAAVVIGREPLVLAGPASYLGELVELAGGVNVAAAIGGRWPRVGMEFLVAARPDVLIDLTSAMGGALKETAAARTSETAKNSEAAETDATAQNPAASWLELGSVPAVANGRIITERDSMMLRPGPRMADAADTLFAALHPALRSDAATMPGTSAPVPDASGDTAGR